MVKLKKLAILLSFALVFAMSGCSGGGNNNNTAGGVTLYWWRPTSDAPEATLKQIAQDFTTQNPGIKVEVVTVDPRSYEEEVTSALASYQTVRNAPDVFSIDFQQLPKFTPQLVPASDDLFESVLPQNQKSGKNTVEYVKDLYEEIVTKSCILKDPAGNQKLYGLPMALDTLSLYINTPVLQRATEALRNKNRADNALSQEQLQSIIKQVETPPTTWNQLLKVVPYITIKDGNTITQSAIAMGTGANVERSADLLQTMMMQNGTQMTSVDQNSAAFNLNTAEAGSATATTNPGLRALDYYTQFSNPQSSLYTWNDKMPNSVEAFKQGQVAMIVHYADLYRYLINEAPSIRNTIDIQPLPQPTDPSSPLATNKLKTMAKMNVEVASSAKGDANRQQASWRFIQYITSRQGANTYLSWSKLASPLKEANEQVKYPALTTQKSWADIWYKGIKPLDVDEDFIGMIENVVNKKKSSKDALDQAAKDVSLILSASKNKWPNVK